MLIMPKLIFAQLSYGFDGDSLTVYDGETYRYTVDTPEGAGLVSTRPDVRKLLTDLESARTPAMIIDKSGNPKGEGDLQPGDMVAFLNGKGKIISTRPVNIRRGALPPSLSLKRDMLTVGVAGNVALSFKAGQRSPMTEVEIVVPAGIDLTMDNTTVNVIGRGDVVLRNLSRQSVGRHGPNFSYNRVGEASIIGQPDGSRILRLTSLDLRPDNGTDVTIVIKGVTINRPGKYEFKASYTTSAPEKLRSGSVKAVLHGVNTISDFERQSVRKASAAGGCDYSWATFSWTPIGDADDMELLATVDEGVTWAPVNAKILPDEGEMQATGLAPDCLYGFKLRVNEGPHKGDSNIVWFRSGEWNVTDNGVSDRGDDVTDALNKLIANVSDLGGGTIYFPSGRYPVRTVHLRSNVWLRVDSGAVISCLPGCDEPEATWFSDRAYRSGLSPVEARPYEDPENYLTKQDVGHTFFHNSMFFGERIENVKIYGNGRITGDGNIFTGDKVMNNKPGARCDKMFAFKLCKDIEIGGFDDGRDLWYDELCDEPYYIAGTGRDYDVSNMLHINRGGHFVLLATGTDGIFVHDTYFGKNSVGNARDIYDFMACNDVRVSNIYSKVSSDDIVKPGSDCSLGFTRPASNYMVRNIIGDTNCNLFQIGSETADDIQDVYVDNIYVLGANKAGFSISTNDGAHIRNVHLNNGKTGPLHSRSVMKRTRAPFFISISNRGRVIGAEAKMFRFMEGGKERHELLVTNSNIGRIDNVSINGVDICEVYGGSSFRGERWREYDGSQHEAAAIIAGFKLPDKEAIVEGPHFSLPDGRNTGYVENISFTNVNMIVKGGHPCDDANASPPEIGVGRYNVGDLKVQPAFGFWFRHARNVVLDGCSLATERPDGRYAICFDNTDVARVRGLSVKADDASKGRIAKIRSANIVEE